MRSFAASLRLPVNPEDPVQGFRIGFPRDWSMPISMSPTLTLNAASKISENGSRLMNLSVRADLSGRDCIEPGEVRGEKLRQYPSFRSFDFGSSEALFLGHAMKPVQQDGFADSPKAEQHHSFCGRLKTRGPYRSSPLPGACLVLRAPGVAGQRRARKDFFDDPYV